MAFQFTQNPTQQSRSVSPTGLLGQFSDPLDCLTAHLMLECAEVLAGVKPANLISLVNRTRPCGRNLYQLWHQHREQLAARFSTLQIMVLQHKGRSLLLLCYNRAALDQHLSHNGIRALLHKAGYPSETDTASLLAQLSQRVASQGSFPHEIGLFIGYPAKDVAAFMGIVKLPFTCQGPWKIFGNPGQSLDLAAQFRSKRTCMGSRLLQCSNLDHCLASLKIDHQLFFDDQLIM